MASFAPCVHGHLLRRLSDMLTERPYLLGDAPSIADFSAYHPIWFTLERTPSLSGILDATPLLKDWMTRMKAIGHGVHEKMTAEQALEAANHATPSDVTQMPCAEFDLRTGEALTPPATSALKTFKVEVNGNQVVVTN